MLYNIYCKFRIAILTIFVVGWQKTIESTERFAKFLEVDVVTPAGHDAELLVWSQGRVCSSHWNTLGISTTLLTSILGKTFI